MQDYKATFTREELELYLKTLDRNVQGPASITLIGGAAAIIHYGVNMQTKDIDLFGVVSADVRQAILATTAQSNLDIEVEVVGVAVPPENFEDRLEVIRIEGLRNLTIKVPERHDLALLKMARSNERDLNALRRMHSQLPFSLETLVTRYIDEGIDLGVPSVGRFNFVHGIGGLFGSKKAVETLEKIERAPVQLVFANATPVKNYRGLEALGIRRSTSESPRFNEAIRQSFDGSIVFPYRDRKGRLDAVGSEFNGSYSVGGHLKKCVWYSQSAPGDLKLVIAQSPFEAMAHFQHHQSVPVRYAALPGDCTDEHARMLKAAVLALGEPREVAIAVSDSRVAALVKKALKSHRVKIELPENSKSWLELAQQRMRSVERSMDR